MTVPDPLETCFRARIRDVGVYESDAAQLQGGGAVAAAPLVLDALIPEDVPDPYVEIRDVEERRLVTAIEVLSPTNKRGPGVEEYRKKRQELLSSEVHYLEVDLLRVGERFPLAGPLPSVPYFVFLSRVNRRPRVEVWPIPLEQPLPTVPVPLLPGGAIQILIVIILTARRDGLQRTRRIRFATHRNVLRSVRRMALA